MPQNLMLERKVIERFFQKQKQERYLHFISSTHNRHKLINKLAHFTDFNGELLNELDANVEEIIIKTLQPYQLDTNCYLVSENVELDTKTLDIHEALRRTIGYGMGTIIIFGEANAIYYEGEDKKTRYMSRLIF